MKKCVNNSIIIHENVTYEDLNQKASYCFILEENLIGFDIGITRNHWELGILTDNNDAYLISTSANNCIEVFKGMYDGKFFKYGYEKDLNINTRILSISSCKSIKIIDIINQELKRIKKHPYRLLYDNCHNNSIYQYLNIINEKPSSALINIVNKNNGLRIFL